jgi:hypothetical protein
MAPPSTPHDRLDGQRVLLISPSFFGYEHDIQAEFRRRGAEIDYVPDRPFESAAMKALTRFQRPLVMPAADRFYRRALEALGRADYDIVLVVNGQTLSGETLTLIKSSFPRAKLILYMWDAMRVRPSVQANLPCFDRALTFDPGDAQQLGLGFRPLFYSRAPASPSDVNEIDVSFVGTIHSDRYAVISSIARNLPGGMTTYLYLYMHAPWSYRVQTLINPHFRNAKIAEFSFAPLPRDEVARVFRTSKAVIDVEYPKQRGLTMRTLETFGAGKKLLTTNAGIADYDIFDAENIHVVDRSAAIAPPDFLNSPYRTPPASLLYKYHISGWLDDVLGVRPPDEGNR